jgi:hypothetical protein
MSDMDTNMDAMSNTLLHMRNQLNDSHRQINLLNEENTRLKTLYESSNNNTSITININDSTSNGTNHTDRSDVSIKNKRLNSSNRTTPNIDITNNLYDVDSIPLNSTNNEHSTRITSLENGINIIS